MVGGQGGVQYVGKQRLAVKARPVSLRGAGELYRHRDVQVAGRQLREASPFLNLDRVNEDGWSLCAHESCRRRHQPGQRAREGAEAA
jgi:hypothetical protein